MTLVKKIKLKDSKGVFEAKSTNSFLARLLFIAKSNRDIDLEEVISNYEFSVTNSVIMQSDGSIIICTNKSELLHILEDLPSQNSYQEPEIINLDNTVLIIDGMCIVNEVMSVACPKSCRDLAVVFINVLKGRSRGYSSVYLIFDNYDRSDSLKDFLRHGVSSKIPSGGAFYIEDSTPIQDSKNFLKNNDTKDALTIYLADKTLEIDMPMATVTRLDVKTNVDGYHPSTKVSSQPEADTLMILHALELSSIRKNVNFLTQDTDVVVLALRRYPLLGPNTAVVIGMGEKRRTGMLKPIYESLGPMRAAALPGFHCITGCDTCGQIRGKGKKNAFKVFWKSSPSILNALADLGKEDKPSTEVLDGCEKFLCQLVRTKKYQGETAGEVRWNSFKVQSGGRSMDKMPPTSGAWHQVILRAHLQASAWHQDMVCNPIKLDPCDLGWYMSEGKFMPKLSELFTAPSAVVELVKCGCVKSNCSKKCSCKQNMMPCTEL